MFNIQNIFNFLKNYIYKYIYLKIVLLNIFFFILNKILIIKFKKNIYFQLITNISFLIINIHYKCLKKIYLIKQN